MSSAGTIASGLLVVLILLHLATTGLVLRRTRLGGRRASPRPVPREPVALVVPIAGLDPLETRSALSALDLAGPGVEVIYCAFSEDDPAVAPIRRALAARPQTGARLLIGRDRVSDNPKMDNVEKGIAAATADVLVFVDGNVDMPADLIDRLTAPWDATTGVVSSPPIGTRPDTFWAEVECAFLNTSYARWQLASEAFGGGYAHGKVFMVRRSLVDRLGGFEALYRDTAEDAAVTRLVRDAGLRVRLTARPFEQPLGRRSFAEVRDRALRWSRLRRRSYPAVYALEIFNGFAVPLAALVVAAVAFGWSLPVALAAIGALTTLWFGAEAVLALGAGWPWKARFFAAALLRDAMAPAIWALGWFGRSYVWRGESVEIGRAQADASAEAAAIEPR